MSESTRERDDVIQVAAQVKDNSGGLRRSDAHVRNVLENDNQGGDATADTLEGDRFRTIVNEIIAHGSEVVTVDIPTDEISADAMTAIKKEYQELRAKGKTLRITGVTQATKDIFKKEGMLDLPKFEVVTREEMSSTGLGKKQEENESPVNEMAA